MRTRTRMHRYGHGHARTQQHAYACMRMVCPGLSWVVQTASWAALVCSGLPWGVLRRFGVLLCLGWPYSIPKPRTVLVCLVRSRAVLGPSLSKSFSGRSHSPPAAPDGAGGPWRPSSPSGVASLTPSAPGRSRPSRAAPGRPRPPRSSPCRPGRRQPRSSPPWAVLGPPSAGPHASNTFSRHLSWRRNLSKTFGREPRTTQDIFWTFQTFSGL